MYFAFHGSHLSTVKCTLYAKVATNACKEYQIYSLGDGEYRVCFCASVSAASFSMRVSSSSQVGMSLMMPTTWPAVQTCSSC